ncbi:MAG: helix-turn-helix domain-containing protein [Verrucomicrobia bacterium]|nr:helix-turn-helix domain-containing protein [Verrucomicrobiota bacterium]
MSWYQWRPYVPVAVRRMQALKEMERLRKKGTTIQPVRIEGRKIARTFWGAAWCDHLESFSDYWNRLPRGRSYVRNGSVCHLDIAKGKVNAMVAGSSLYEVKVAIKTLPSTRWKDMKTRCAGQIGSLLELLQGRLSDNVMKVVTDRDKGLFPLPGEISLECSCPDWAVMCKHVAAVLYGVGARLDEKPELLFLLRGVDHEELISDEIGLATATAQTGSGRKRIADEALADVFGIEISEDTAPARTARAQNRTRAAAGSKDASRATAKRIVKPKAKAVARARRAKATSAAGAKTSSRVARRTLPVTGRSVLQLRAEFGMTRAEFARLLGVTAPSVSNWEKKTGTLHLHQRTLDAWTTATRLTRQQAWRKMRRS